MKLAISQEKSRRGWTTQHIADEVGISRSAVCQILKGKIKPSYDTLKKIESLFGMGHAQLFEQTSEEPAAARVAAQTAAKGERV